MDADEVLMNTDQRRVDKYTTKARNHRQTSTDVANQNRRAFDHRMATKQNFRVSELEHDR